jgi:hypothetical protein
MTTLLWDRYMAWTAADIVAMNGVVQENRHLDFKLLAKPEFGPDDQRHLAKAISGFANADGGVILWGVDARRDPADEYIDQVVATPGVPNARTVLARLNELSSTASAPGLKGLDHRIIEDDGTQSFVATFVPEGESGPYMAMLDQARHRYYRRIGSAFTPMDHSMIADMFGRRPRPVLRLELHPESPDNLSVRVIVSNVGRGIARAPYLMLKVNSPLTISQSGMHFMPLRPGPTGWSFFAQDMNSVIHPGLALQWVPIYGSSSLPSPHERSKLHTIAYRLGAADIPEASGRIVLTFDPPKVAFDEPDGGRGL